MTNAPEPPPTPITDAMATVVDWLFDPATLASGDATGPEPAVERAARRLFLDTLGCAIGGGAKPELVAINESVAAIEPGPIRLPGMGRAVTGPAAASWVAMAATWDEACEGLARAHGRPGLHAFPAALALTVARGGSLGDGLTALIRGYEVAGRAGERLRIGPGRHVDGTWGTFGAVTAAGSVLGLGPGEVMAAIEAAACQVPVSLYLPVAQGATARNSYVGEAVRRAISLAQLVPAGVTTTTGALDTVAELVLDGAGADAAVAPPGEWLLLQGYLKPFAAVRHVHYGAEAARRWRADAAEPAPAAGIDAIELAVYPEAVTYCGNRSPRTAIEAQFSLTYGVARMLVAGDLGPDAYTALSLADPEVRRIEQLIEVRPGPNTGPDPDGRYAELSIATATDRSTIRVDAVAGDADLPLTDDEVAAKFRDYTTWLPGPWSAERVLEAVLDGPLDAPLSEVIGPSPES